MELIKPDVNFDFVGKRKIAIICSLTLIFAGIVSLIVNGGPSYGIDFAGGTQIQVQFVKPTTANEIRKALGGLHLGGVVVQQLGQQSVNEFLIRSQMTSSGLKSLAQNVEDALTKTYGAKDVDVRQADMVGPRAGKDLREKGMLAVVYAMIGLLIYISWRFEFRFAVGAIIALVHDVTITLGAFSLLNKDIDLSIIAAFLALIGYSLNDTIIVYDRIRETRGKLSGQPFPAIVNRAINDTLSRTILTSGFTLLVVIALFFLGGSVIHNFAFALLIGIIVGTYSSVFIASPVVLLWDDLQKRKAAKARG